MAGNKNTGMSKKLAKETYNKVQGYVEDYEKVMNALHDAEVNMNKEAWYGGKRANKQYKSLQTNYANSVEYLTKLKQVQKLIHGVYAKAKGVDF